MKEFYFELRQKSKRKYYYQEVPEPTEKSVTIDESDMFYDENDNEIGTGLCYVTYNGKLIEDGDIPRYYHENTVVDGFDSDIADELIYNGISKDNKNTLRLYRPEVKRLV